MVVYKLVLIMNKAEFVHTWIIAILYYFLKSDPIVLVIPRKITHFEIIRNQDGDPQVRLSL
jgi:hypothetical protein